jgi:hypothetical protein
MEFNIINKLTILEPTCTSRVAKFGHVGGRSLLRYYDLYQRLQLRDLCTLDDGCDGHLKHVE